VKVIKKRGESNIFSNKLHRNNTFTALFRYKCASQKILSPCFFVQMDNQNHPKGIQNISVDIFLVKRYICYTILLYSMNLECNVCKYIWTSQDAMFPNRCANPDCRSLNWNDAYVVTPTQKDIDTDIDIPTETPGLLSESIEDDRSVYLPRSLWARMTAGGTYNPQPQWDRERDLVLRWKTNQKIDNLFLSEFKEWFIIAFNFDANRQNHIAFLERGGPLRSSIKKRIDDEKWGFGPGLELITEKICDDIYFDWISLNRKSSETQQDTTQETIPDLAAD
jgi:hypothetical protein